MFGTCVHTATRTCPRLKYCTIIISSSSSLPTFLSVSPNPTRDRVSGYEQTLPFFLPDHDVGSVTVCLSSELIRFSSELPDCQQLGGVFFRQNHLRAETPLDSSGRSRLGALAARASLTRWSDRSRTHVLSEDFKGYYLAVLRACLCFAARAAL